MSDLPPELGTRSWFAIDGSLEPLAYGRPSFFRFPEALAEMVILRFSAGSAWVLDPFCGFGTTPVAAQHLGRQAIGFERDPARGAFAAGRVHPPNRVIVDDAARAGTYSLPAFDLVLTSLPYTTFRDWEDVDGRRLYLDDLVRIVGGFAGLLKPDAPLVVEACNVRAERGGPARMVAWEIARALAVVYWFEGEIVRCNTGPEPAGPGYDHSYLLVFRNRPPAGDRGFEAL